MKETINQRKNVRQECIVSVDGKKGTEFDEVRTMDIGRGGIGFLSKKEISLNRKIAIELDLTSDGEPVLVLGQVKWVKKVEGTGNYRVGLKFTETLETSSKSRLREYFPS